MRWWVASVEFMRTSWRHVFNVPTVASLGTLTIGCIPPLKWLFFGDGSPLAFLTDAINILGTAMIPCMMIVMGSVLYKGPGSAKLPVRLIVGVVACRQVIIPAIGTAVIVSSHRAGLFYAPNSFYLFTLLLNWTTPTAINIQTVAVLHQNGEAEVSCLLFWQYMCCVVTLPCWLSLYLYLIG
jgi:predicted permease